MLQSPQQQRRKLRAPHGAKKAFVDLARKQHQSDRQNEIKTNVDQ